MIKILFLIVLSFFSLTSQAKSGDLWEYSVFHLCLLQYGESKEVRKTLNQIQPQARNEILNSINGLKPYQKCVVSKNIRSKQFCQIVIADGLNALGLRMSAKRATRKDTELMNPTISKKLDQCSL